MRKIKICIVIFSCIALYFMGMSIFADKSSSIGAVISLIGSVSLLIASFLSIVRIIIENRNKRGHRGRLETTEKVKQNVENR